MDALKEAIGLNSDCGVASLLVVMFLKESLENSGV